MLVSATVNFGSWFELGEAPRVAPPETGVLQARSSALRRYPAGRSAMVFYGASRADESLRDYVAGRGAPVLERASALGAGLVRFGATPEPDAALATLLRRFVERFGAPPVANETGATRDV
jgi:hypothetical protein